MKPKLSYTLAVFSVFFITLLPAGASPQYTRQNGTWVIGSETATEPDRVTALSEATDGATDHVNRACVIGSITQIVKTQTSCDKQDDGDGNVQYTCVVQEKDFCQ